MHRFTYTQHNCIHILLELDKYVPDSNFLNLCMVSHHVYTITLHQLLIGHTHPIHICNLLFGMIWHVKKIIYLTCQSAWPWHSHSMLGITCLQLPPENSVYTPFSSSLARPLHLPTSIRNGAVPPLNVARMDLYMFTLLDMHAQLDVYPLPCNDFRRTRL